MYVMSVGSAREGHFLRGGGGALAPLSVVKMRRCELEPSSTGFGSDSGGGVRRERGGTNQNQQILASGVGEMGLVLLRNRRI